MNFTRKKADNARLAVKLKDYGCTFEQIRLRFNFKTREQARKLVAFGRTLAARPETVTKPPPALRKNPLTATVPPAMRGPSAKPAPRLRKWQILVQKSLAKVTHSDNSHSKISPSR